MDRRDEEQIEQLKEWWRRNGPSIMLGLSAAIVVVAGWWAYGTWQERAAQQAAAAYAEFLQHRGGDIEELASSGQDVMEQHRGSGYAMLTAMRLARHQIEAGANADAAQTLGWLVENSEHQPTVQLARLRQARALAQSDPQRAIELLGNEASAGFKAVYAELKGDLLAAQGRLDEAAQAYRQALTAKGLASQSRELVKIKLRAVESEA